jgi:anaerobic ribonucleoside-triphosphate reductase activating protein
LHIAATQYTLSTSSLDIYFSGCNPPHCKDCSNPELWKFVNKNNYIKKFKDIEEKVKNFNTLIENIMLFGGEPLDQNHDEFLDFLNKLKTLNKKIYLFTKYDIDEVPENIKFLCNYIKCGRYLPELKTDDNIMYGITLATSNQIIYKLF